MDAPQENYAGWRKPISKGYIMCDPCMNQPGDNMIMEMEGVGWLKGGVRGLVGMGQLNFLVAVEVP